MSRAHTIRKRLDHYFINEVGAAVATPEPTPWRDMQSELGPHAFVGWGFPLPNDDPKFQILVPFCPEIIDETTSHLSEEELDDYLAVIEFLSALQIGYWDDEPTPEARLMKAEDVMYNEGAGSMILLNEVEMRALDRAT